MPDYPLAEAARRLGTTTEALRARLKRKSLDGFRDNKGRWRVILADGQTLDQAVSGDASGRLSGQGTQVSGHDQTVMQLRERVAFLEGKLEGVEARLSDRDRELAELKAERERLLTIVEKAQATIARCNQGILARLWQRFLEGGEKT